MALITLLGRQEDVTAHQGNTIQLEFDLHDELNLPFDMSNCLLNSQLRYASNGQVACTLSQANGKISYVNAQQGRWRIVLQPADTSTLRFVTGEDSLELLYDIEVTHPEYGVFKPYWGSLTLQREQTRTP